MIMTYAELIERIYDEGPQLDPDKIERLLYDITDPTSGLEDGDRVVLMDTLLYILHVLPSVPQAKTGNKHLVPKKKAYIKSWIDRRRAQMRAERRAGRMFWITLAAAVASVLAAAVAWAAVIRN